MSNLQVNNFFSTKHEINEQENIFTLIWSTLKSAVFGLSSSLPTLLVEVYWCESRLVKLICSQIIWRQAVQGVSWSAAHLPSVSETSNLRPQVEWGQASLFRLGPLCPAQWVLFFVRKLLMHWPPSLVECFGGLFDCVVSRLARERPMSPLLRKVHRPPRLPTTDQFP